MRRGLALFAIVSALALGAGLYLTRPEVIAPEEIAGIEPDLARGEHVFHAAGCASCHAADEATGEDRLILSGGHRLVTEFGTFVAPNISQDTEHGIGGWSRAEVVTALVKGTSRDGRHLYPALPYAAYEKAELSDMVSLAAFLETLPADPTPSPPHELSFPFSIRAGIGLWKAVNLGGGWAVDVPEDDPELVRGRYLAEALSHCGECHTPRDPAQGLDTARWFAGAPNPSGKGRIPNITPAGLDWSEDDVAAFLETGFKPDFDVAGGSMTAVVTEMGLLPKEDVAAIAAYVKAVPAAE